MKNDRVVIFLIHRDITSAISTLHVDFTEFTDAAAKMSTFTGISHIPGANLLKLVIILRVILIKSSNRTSSEGYVGALAQE